MADDNRPLKYARYAIGEILLMVVGILIALQIDTWNEERESKKAHMAYMDRLTGGLKSDMLMLSDHITVAEIYL